MIDLWVHENFNSYVLIKKPVTPANKGRVILAMCIINMDPFVITNL